MTKKYEQVVGRRDMYFMDPKQLIVQDGWNPRKDFSPALDEDDQALVESIRENGVLMPITVRNIDDKMFLVDGWRRFCAVTYLNENGAEIKSIPAMLARRNISDVEAMLTALNSNTGKPLRPTEEADAFNRLVGWGLSQSDIARKIGKSPTHVKRRIELVDAAPEVKTAVDKKEINLNDAIEIVQTSKGNIEKQRDGLEVAKQAKAERRKNWVERKKAQKNEAPPATGTDTPESNEDKPKPGEFKMLSRKQIETLLTERKGIVAFNTENEKLLNDGLIIGLTMVLYGQTTVTGILGKK